MLEHCQKSQQIRHDIFWIGEKKCRPYILLFISIPLSRDVKHNLNEGILLPKVIEWTICTVSEQLQQLTLWAIAYFKHLKIHKQKVTKNAIMENVLQIWGEKWVNLINGEKEYLLRKVSAV
jgi:hypothetical protein